MSVRSMITSIVQCSAAQGRHVIATISTVPASVLCAASLSRWIALSRDKLCAEGERRKRKGREGKGRKGKRREGYVDHASVGAYIDYI